MKLGLIDWIIIASGVLAVGIFTAVEVVKFIKEKKEKDQQRIEKKEVVSEVKDDDEE